MGVLLKDQHGKLSIADSRSYFAVASAAVSGAVGVSSVSVSVIVTVAAAVAAPVAAAAKAKNVVLVVANAKAGAIVVATVALAAAASEFMFFFFSFSVSLSTWMRWEGSIRWAVVSTTTATFLGPLGRLRPEPTVMLEVEAAAFSMRKGCVTRRVGRGVVRLGREEERRLNLIILI